MSEQEIYERITPIFQEHFEQPELVPRHDMVASDVEGWDSLAHIGLIVEIEKEFGIRIGLGESGRLQNVGALVQSIGAKLA